MGNILCSKSRGMHGGLITSGSNNVNEEYKQAFRTTSYIDISNKVQHHFVTTTLDDHTQYSPISTYLLDPHVTSISKITSNPNHQFLVNYFNISLEASTFCESLLTNIHHARINHRKIKKLIKRLPENSNPSNDEYRVLYEKLASFASTRNPFSTMNPQRFQDLHETHEILFRELTSRCRKINRRKKIIKLIKRVLGSFLIVGCGALSIALLILVMHCPVGLVAVPGLVVWYKMAKKIRRTKRKCDEKWLEGLVVKMDIAARGVYIMINDFGTLSQIVKRLRDEMERRKNLAGICVGKGKGKNEMLREVVREFQMHESWFVEELEELEKQICLCFLDINRSTRLLVRELMCN